MKVTAMLRTCLTLSKPTTAVPVPGEPVGGSCAAPVRFAVQFDQGGLTGRGNEKRCHSQDCHSHQ